MSHPDLNVIGGVSYVGDNEPLRDGHGHGTHVAGTIGAKNDGNGIVGVAPGVPLVALKVCLFSVCVRVCARALDVAVRRALSRSTPLAQNPQPALPPTPQHTTKVLASDGSGSMSNVIAAVNWVANNGRATGMRVVNLSLGGAKSAALCAAMQAAVVYFRLTGEALGFDEIAGYIVTVDNSTRRDPDPQRHEFYQDLLARQQYLVETLHAGGFL